MQLRSLTVFYNYMDEHAIQTVDLFLVSVPGQYRQNIHRVMHGSW